MKLMTKIIIAISALLLAMLIIPLLVVKLASADAGMALCFILFFLIDPLVIIFLSIMAGTDLRKLWWIPITAAIVFPIFFGAAVEQIVVDLFIYSALYVVVGVLAMLSTHFGMKIANKKKAESKTGD